MLKGDAVAPTSDPRPRTLIDLVLRYSDKTKLPVAPSLSQVRLNLPETSGSNGIRGSKSPEIYCWSPVRYQMTSIPAFAHGLGMMAANYVKPLLLSMRADAD